MKRSKKNGKENEGKQILDKTHSLFAHSTNDGDQEILAIVEAGLNIFAYVAFGKLDIVLWGAVLGHEVEETIVDVDLFGDRVSHN